MNRNLKVGIWFAGAATLFACSTASVRMMPGENGIHRVVVRDVERDSAEEATIDAAADYCRERNQEAVFINNDNAKYTGEMGEGTRNAIRKGSTAAMMLGGVGVIPDASRTAGAIVGSAGMIGRTITNDRDYQVEAKFKCKRIAE